MVPPWRTLPDSNSNSLSAGIYLDLVKTSVISECLEPFLACFESVEASFGYGVASKVKGKGKAVKTWAVG